MGKTILEASSEPAESIESDMARYHKWSESEGEKKKLEEAITSEDDRDKNDD